ncbi:MAG: hypothetical protein NZM35_10920 [Chitinophagales bacterium]|nr:hypothetical protein [Chitinophagales bacterium]MDW8419396.1 hypothetical protein [Chitinophagales bacterium]
MINPQTYYYILYAWIALAIVSFPFLLKQTAPYGRHASSGWGPMMDNRLGWIIQEGVAPFFISYWFFTGTLPKTLMSYVLYGLYVLHYLYRSFVYPLRIRTTGKKIPVLIVVLAVLFNFCNTFVIGYYLGNIGGNYNTDYFVSFPFIAGVLLFGAGVYINIRSDNILISLRRPGETGYQIPRGFLFEKISCPNLFGEIVEWLGYAVMNSSLAAFSFSLWTAVNLIPRALDHHRWYLQKFPDYPPHRKAVIPYIW